MFPASSSRTACSSSTAARSVRRVSYLPRGSIVDVVFFLLTCLTVSSRPEGVPQAVPGRRHRLRRDGRSRIRRQAECVFCLPQSRNVVKSNLLLFLQYTFPLTASSSAQHKMSTLLDGVLFLLGKGYPGCEMMQFFE